MRTRRNVDLLFRHVMFNFLRQNKFELLLLPIISLPLRFVIVSERKWELFSFTIYQVEASNYFDRVAFFVALRCNIRGNDGTSLFADSTTNPKAICSGSNSTFSTLHNLSPVVAFAIFHSTFITRQTFINRNLQHAFNTLGTSPQWVMKGKWRQKVFVEILNLRTFSSPYALECRLIVMTECSLQGKLL